MSSVVTRVIHMSLFLGVCSGGGWYAYKWNAEHAHLVGTDNAYVAAEAFDISAQTGGTVLSVNAVDSQEVSKGSPIVQIDPIDATNSRDVALADVEKAKADVDRAQADVDRAQAEVARTQAIFEGAGIEIAKAVREGKRRLSLAGTGDVSEEELQSYRTLTQRTMKTADEAKSSVSSAKAALLASKAVLFSANSALVGAKARLSQFELEVSRSTLTSPVDGVIAKRSVNPGARVAPGQHLLTVYPKYSMHVDANFKEGQLTNVSVGMPVTLTSEYYGKKVVFHGVVEGFSAGTGSAFAAIPAQNATGNWIKVVQRLPVRIKLEPSELRANPLRVGLTMYAEIDTSSAGRNP